MSSDLGGVLKIRFGRVRQVEDESGDEKRHDFRLHRRSFPHAAVIDGDASQGLHGGRIGGRRRAVAATLRFSQRRKSILVINTDVVNTLR